MTLATAVAPLAAYAVIFQTLVYLSLPARLRRPVAPVVTGLVGAALTVGAGVIFGFAEIGLGGGNPRTVLAWGFATVVVMATAGAVLIKRADARERLADSWLASLGPVATAREILVRIPLFTALIEEAFFRGLLHAALIALYPTEVAIWIGAGLFGLWHIGPGVDEARSDEKSVLAQGMHTALTVVVMTAAGAFLVWLRIETGSIWAPFAVHAAVNITMALYARSAGRRLSTPTA